jgi:TolB protein
MLLVIMSSACEGAATGSEIPPLLFLGWDAAGQTQLFAWRAGEVSALTAEPQGINDYALSPDAKLVAYSVIATDGSSELKLVGADAGSALVRREPARTLLQCPEAECVRPVWAPDGRLLLYERSQLAEDGSVSATSLWWLDSLSGETVPLVEGEDARGSAARFSPDGQWVSYFSPESETTQVFNLEDGSRLHFANELGGPVAWNPNSGALILSNLNMVIVHGSEGQDHQAHSHDFLTAEHLFLTDIVTGEQEELAPDLNTEDNAAGWSPNGEWIAFGRRNARTAAGRQIWLMRADGSEARSLTADVNLTYGPPRWSADGRVLAVQQFDLSLPDSRPSIWVFDVARGTARQLLDAGMEPTWLQPLNGAGG